MKKILCLILLFFVTNLVKANPNEYDALYHDYQAVYTPSEAVWTSGGIADDSIVLTKKLVEGTGSYSKYLYSDGSLAFALASNSEFIKNGKFIVVDNNLLKFSEIVYNEGSFEEIPLDFQSIQQLFEDVEIIKISKIDSDNKTWIHKPLFKKKEILLLNDTDRFFHGIKKSGKKVQDENIKGLITLSRYGIYSFKHFGERNGKLIFYVR